MVRCIPHRWNVDGTVGVDIKISAVLDDTPRNGGVLPLDLIGELGNQVSDLNNAHTAGVKYDALSGHFCP